MNDDLEHEIDGLGRPEDPFRAFAMACRAERDRLARATLDAEDRRFDTAGDARTDADQRAADLFARMSET